MTEVASKQTQAESDDHQEPILYTEGLTKRFGNFTAVDDVSFSIAPNETQALIGPNGAGKTTFQNLVTGKLPLTEGKIVFRGEDISDEPPYRRAKMGIVRKYQVTSVYENETVLENMRLALRGRTASPLKLAFTSDDSDIHDRIEELLAIGGLSGLETEKAGRLSHGEKQWLEIMMAVGADPDLLLLDEPTSGMSVGETNDTADLIENIRQREDVAILVIEHDMDFIRQVSSNITVLNHGEVIARGTVEEIENDEMVQRIYLGREA
jgi:ABC-type uncharacterized transport system ATPase subunit